MQIVIEGTRAETYGGRFTGDVQLDMLALSDTPDRPDTALGHFHAGAVTYWHSHPGGQLLWLVSGSGRVGTATDAAVTIAPGTLVVAPAGERHWHGAAAGADAAWLTLTWGTTAWEDLPGG